MPELPEVETVMRGMAKVVDNQRIADIQLFSKQLRLPIPKELKTFAGEHITRLRRRAKYIIIPVKSGRVMILHLGMTGRVTINPDHSEKHDHFALTMKNGDRLVYNDARRFGLIEVSDEASLPTHRFFAHLGPEPFDDTFSAAYLRDVFSGKRVGIKVAVMDQAVVVGVGNIYAAEALYRARINPYLPAGEATAAQLRELVKQIRIVLQQSIDAGGSSLRDYVQTDGELGYYQDQWRVYGRAGDKCLRRGCAGHIARGVQGGRSTFYCPDCQK